MSHWGDPSRHFYPSASCAFLPSHFSLDSGSSGSDGLHFLESTQVRSTVYPNKLALRYFLRSFVRQHIGATPFFSLPTSYMYCTYLAVRGLAYL